MKRIYLAAAGVFIGSVLTSSSTHANTTRFTIELQPLDCVEQTIENGVSTEVTLAPKDCYDLIPEPIPGEEVTNGSQGMAHVKGPNTGANASILDGAEEYIDLLIATSLSLCIFMLSAIGRRRRR